MIRDLVYLFAWFMACFSIGSLLFMVVDHISHKLQSIKSKKENQRMLDNPYEYYGLPKVKIKDVKLGSHRDIGGKIGYIERTPDINEILQKALKGNLACLNFVRFRNDIFEDFDDYEIPDDKLIKPNAYDLKYYYVKVKTDINNIFLGYIVASDEIEMEEDHGNN